MTKGKLFRRGTLGLFAAVLVACGKGDIAKPLEDCAVTSCSACTPFTPLPIPAPDKPQINEHAATLAIGGAARLTVCFYRDKERTAEAQAITWTSLDPAIATVSPTTGPTTLVTGVGFGRTAVRAVITGIPVDARITVCQPGLLVCP